MAARFTSPSFLGAPLTLQVLQEDIDAAYKAHTSWYLDPRKTPPALALARFGIKAACGYDYLEFFEDYEVNKKVALTSELKAYMLKFGLSLYENISEAALASIKQLHKSNSDWATPVSAGKRSDRVKPQVFEIAL